MPQAPNHIFDRHRVRQHHERARAGFAAHDFLLREMALRLEDRLHDTKRAFHSPLVLGAMPGFNAPSHELLDDAPLPFNEQGFDLIIACGTLHWVNDLVGLLIQIRHLLMPGGLFLGMLPGGETLRELRVSFEQAEMALKGGVSPRISPFVDVRDAGNLLSRAGFVLPVADSETLDVEYEHPLRLMQELRGMGQGNALARSVRHFTPRALMMNAAIHYQQYFPGEEGRVRASFELVALTGWKPD